MRKIRPCPICRESSTVLIHKNLMASIDDLDMSYSVDRCCTCGFHFARELPDQSQYVRYYNELSKYDSQISVSLLDKQRIDAAIELCSRHGISKDARIVDLGCGFGALLAAFRDLEYRNLRGIDPAPHSAQQAREQFALDGIYHGTLADAGALINLAEADLVCLMAVLEHLPELRDDLGRLFSQLRPGTLVLVEVPALELFDGNAGEPFGELSLEHIQFFSVQSMRNLLVSFGLTILAFELLRLPILNSGELFMLAEIGGKTKQPEPENDSDMRDYLTTCSNRWSTARQKIPDQPFVMYGAGSHSARLIPTLNNHQRAHLKAVFDANVNLHGKLFDDWVVQAPTNLSDYPDLPVLISSYRSEVSIANDLKQRFPHRTVQLMYHDV